MRAAFSRGPNPLPFREMFQQALLKPRRFKLSTPYCLVRKLPTGEVLKFGPGKTP